MEVASAMATAFSNCVLVELLSRAHQLCKRLPDVCRGSCQQDRHPFLMCFSAICRQVGHRPIAKGAFLHELINDNLNIAMALVRDDTPQRRRDAIRRAFEKLSEPITVTPQ
ncbi:hypothetical protein XM50_08865 [Sphingomonas sp. Ag1]|nr:hypothetical protein XM50_08865 [Sphingomonas sp. Ag1]